MKVLQIISSLFRHRHRWVYRFWKVGPYDLWYEKCKCGKVRMEGLEEIITSEEFSKYVNNIRNGQANKS
jgi:hypothetical protein